MQNLGIQLADVAVRNTAATIADRVAALRAKKKSDESIAELEQMVYELIDDKSELVRIAKAFEERLVAQRLSSTDVEYISTNVVPVLQQLAQSAGAASTDPNEIIELLKPLLSVETVTVMQLVGFNFSKAIGEPLTDLVRRLILARAPDSELQKLTLQREALFMQVANDPEAYGRLRRMQGHAEND